MKVAPQRNVCFICYRMYPDTNFENYSHYVSENGYCVTVIAYKGAGQQEFESIGNTKVIRIPLPSTNKARRKWRVFATAVIKFLKHNNFSIVHIHNTCPYFVLYRLMTNNRSKFIYHNTSYPVGVSKFRAYKRIFSDFIQALFMDRLIIQSEELKERLFGIRNLKKAKVVPIGFNPRIHCTNTKEQVTHLKKRIGIKANEKVLIYIGSMARFRRLDSLIEAFASVYKENKSTRLLMIGDGDDLKNLKLQVHRLGITANVFFSGKVPHGKVVEYLGISDIGISYVPINDSYSYNPPLKTFEYLSCGLPVIATKTVSNSMIIQDQINGILVRDNDQALSNAVVALLNDPARLKSIRRNSKKSVMGNDFETITKRHLLPLYDSILNCT